MRMLHPVCTQFDACLVAPRRFFIGSQLPQFYIVQARDTGSARWQGAHTPRIHTLEVTAQQYSSGPRPSKRMGPPNGGI